MYIMIDSYKKLISGYIQQAKRSIKLNISQGNVHITMSPTMHKKVIAEVVWKNASISLAVKAIRVSIALNLRINIFKVLQMRFGHSKWAKYHKLIQLAL